MTFDDRLKEAMREIISAVKFTFSVSDKEAQEEIAEALEQKPLLNQLLCNIVLQKADDAMNN